jgi:3-hydroxybutyryl-CoA dehydrogenase
VSPSRVYERPAVAGGGTVACGLAAVASVLGDVRLLARSDASAWRAEESAQARAAKLEEGDPKRIKVTTDPADLSECDFIVEAIVEHPEAKADQLEVLGEISSGSDLATTTSSLSVSELAAASRCEGRLYGLHVFNPVERMELVELCFPEGMREGIPERARGWCDALGKTAVEVPDQAGFVVNRLLFPFLFDAVRLLESTGMEPADVDACMRLGAGHPMGPLSLLDFVGIDVAVAIGESLYAESGSEAPAVPDRLRELAASDRLGRKSGAGFFEY